jgi:hypothetical protein
MELRLRRAAFQTYREEEINQRQKAVVVEREKRDENSLLPRADRKTLKICLIVKEMAKKKPMQRKRNIQNEDGKRILKRTASETEVPKKASKKRVGMEKKPTLLEKKAPKTRTQKKKPSVKRTKQKNTVGTNKQDKGRFEKEAKTKKSLIILAKRPAACKHTFLIRIGAAQTQFPSS